MMASFTARYYMRKFVELAIRWKTYVVIIPGKGSGPWVAPKYFLAMEDTAENHYRKSRIRGCSIRSMAQKTELRQRTSGRDTCSQPQPWITFFCLSICGLLFMYSVHAIFIWESKLWFCSWPVPKSVFLLSNLLIFDVFCKTDFLNWDRVLFLLLVITSVLLISPICYAL